MWPTLSPMHVRQILQMATATAETTVFPARFPLQPLDFLPPINPCTDTAKANPRLPGRKNPGLGFPEKDKLSDQIIFNFLRETLLLPGYDDKMSQLDPVAYSPYSSDDDIHERNFAKRRCCFWLPFLNTEPSPSNRESDLWQRIRCFESPPNTASAVAESSWWGRRWRTFRGWSGPGKSLLRRFKRKRRRANKYGRLGKFQYDPTSYALNFDEGPGENRLFDEDIIGRAFSSRYSLPPSAKSSLDFDGEGMTFM